MASIEFSDVQWINLKTLLAIRDGIYDDPAATCCKFLLTAQTAEAIRRLSPDRILMLVTNLGDEALFPARNDLEHLINLPLPLTAAIAAAQPRDHTVPATPAGSASTTLGDPSHGYTSRRPSH